MERFAGVIWAGSFDERLFKLITVFAAADLPVAERVRSLFFDMHTVETLCNATVRAEDAVVCTDAVGNESHHPTSILTEAEKQQMFSTVRFTMSV
jgi:hypothetical protein